MGFLARGNDVQQQRLAVAAEKCTAALYLLELVLSVSTNWKGLGTEAFEQALPLRWERWRGCSSPEVSFHLARKHQSRLGVQ